MKAQLINRKKMEKINKREFNPLKCTSYGSVDCQQKFPKSAFRFKTLFQFSNFTKASKLNFRKYLVSIFNASVLLSWTFYCHFQFYPQFLHKMLFHKDWGVSTVSQDLPFHINIITFFCSPLISNWVVYFTDMGCTPKQCRFSMCISFK